MALIRKILQLLSICQLFLYCVVLHVVVDYGPFFGAMHGVFTSLALYCILRR